MTTHTNTACVIGGSGGIGLAITRRLLQRGDFVFSSYHSRRSVLEAGLADFSKSQYELLNIDATSTGSIGAAFDLLLAKRPTLDTLVYTPTRPITNRPVLDLQWSDFQEHLDSQVHGLFACMQKLKPQIKEKKRLRIIVVLSDYVVGAPPTSLSHYVTGKYALLGFAKSLAADLARFNTTVNMVSPGMVQTNLLSSLPAKLIQITAESNPLKRIATPDDVAGTVAFLASADADYLNGANLTINGGRLMP